MESEVTRFYIRKRNRKLIFAFLVLIFWSSELIFDWINPNKGNTLPFKVFSTLFWSIPLFFSANDIFYIFSMTKKNIPAISIYDDKIGISQKAFFRIKVKFIKFNDITVLYMPKWDKNIQITTDDSKKDIINLFEYEDEDIIKIKEIFTEVKGKLQT